jgi:hypothetical protein
MTKLWKARETVLRALAAITVNTTQLLDAQVASGAIESKCKNVTVVEPEGAIDKQDFLGETSDFQNAELDEKPFGLARISGTLVQDGDEVLETFAFGSGTAITATHHRYQAGLSTSGKTRVAAAFLVNLDDGTDEVTILLNNAWIIKLGDRRIAGPDGHWEQDFEAVCLPKDYYVEIKD